jgi:hypothetical protein
MDYDSGYESEEIKDTQPRRLREDELFEMPKSMDWWKPREKDRDHPDDNAPPMSDSQEKLLNLLFYDKKLMFGRDKLFKYIQANHPESSLSRRQVGDFLRSQEVNQLYAPKRKTKDIKPTVLKKPFAQVAIDLVDMSTKSYDGFNWILTGTDLFTKKAYAVPMSDKEADTVVKAWKEMLKQMVKKPSTIRHDNGSEFKADVFKKFNDKEGIKQIFSSANKPYSNGGVERMNATIKRLINKDRTQFDNPDWVSFLPLAIENINNTVSRVTGKTPLEVEKESEKENKETEAKIKKEVMPDNQNELKTKINVGDNVRIKLEDEGFSKGGYNWSKEIYEVAKVRKPGPKSSVKSISFKLINPENKKEFDDIFYQNDLLKVSQVKKKVNEPDKFIISKLLKPMVRRDKITRTYEQYYEVRFRNDKSIYYIARSDLENDVPKLLKQFEIERNVKWGKSSVKFDKKK